MKKLISILAAFTLVFGIAGFASAACLNCAGDPGQIARGCESGQDIACYPFDFEDNFQLYSYCAYPKDRTDNIALFKICDCIPEVWETAVAGDTVDISMEILVDKGTGMVSGDNGVYWAQDVNETGIDVTTWEDQETACDQGEDYIRSGEFVGNFIYKTANGTVGSVNDGISCTLADLERVVKFGPPTNALDQAWPHGYVIGENEVNAGAATWQIDIPYLRADPDKVQAGWKVYVKICLILDCSGICSDDLECCCTIYIGELCCDDYANCDLVYPYFPPANGYWNLNGMVITNLSDFEGTATINYYEADGDQGTVTVTVGANSIYLVNNGSLVGTLTQTKWGSATSTLGDDKGYALVETTFASHGFMMIANTVTGESMGYIPDASCFGKYLVNDHQAD